MPALRVWMVLRQPGIRDGEDQGIFGVQRPSEKGLGGEPLAAFRCALELQHPLRVDELYVHHGL